MGRGIFGPFNAMMFFFQIIFFLLFFWTFLKSFFVSGALQTGMNRKREKKIIVLICLDFVTTKSKAKQSKTKQNEKT
jgi:hypothetical protein